MEWITVKSEEDIEELHEKYQHFEDSYLIRFSFESGNYVDEERVGHIYNNNILVLKFERLDDHPFSIEMMFEETRRLNCFFPVEGKDNWMVDILYAKIAKNEEFFYWTLWEDFDPYNSEHLKYNDFTLIEARSMKWRIVE